MRRRMGLERLLRLGPGVAALAGWLGITGAPAFEVQGHRGARGLRPENTLAAFTAALEIGVSALELDVGVTADGVVVVSHDPELNPDLARRPDGSWLSKPGPTLRSLRYSELSRYDVGRIRPGSRYAARFPAQRPVDGARIPTLAAVFQLARRMGNEKVRFSIELKIDPGRPEATLAPEPFAEAVVRVVRRAGGEERTTIQSFDWRALRYIQRVAPRISTAYLTVEESWRDNVQRGRRGRSAWLAGFDVDDFGGSVPRLVAAAGGAVWSPFYRDLDRAQLDEARRLGITVIVWTVNDPVTMGTLVDLGVDGIITDYPDRLRAVMRERGLTPPAR